MAHPGTHQLWAITCYFNPVHYQRRIENYRVFRKHLAVPLVTVELSFDGTFELSQRDADVLVQLHGGDVMWQKERLLNIALQQVPDTCDKVAWLDCDIIFACDDWAQRASHALDTLPLVHLLHERVDLPPDVTLDQISSLNAPTGARSVVYQMATGEAAPEDLLMGHPRERRLATTGLAWASPREALEAHGLYDACIVGGGDRAILCAALGVFDYAARSRMNARRAEHYLMWARRYFATVQGRVGYIPGRVFHLWHGEVKDRQYEERPRGLETSDFDPFLDIALDPSGCWRWNSDKRELHAFVRRYFELRREDGVETGSQTLPREHRVPLDTPIRNNG